MQEHADYRFTTSAGNGILEIVIQGELNMQTLSALRGKVLESIKQSDAHGLLFDILSSTGRREIVDAYYLPRSLPADIRILPLAIVDKADDFYFQSFFEATAANVGMTVKWFTSAENARAWLKNRIGKPITP